MENSQKTRLNQKQIDINLGHRTFNDTLPLSPIQEENTVFTNITFFKGERIQLKKYKIPENKEIKNSINSMLGKDNSSSNESVKSEIAQLSK